MQGYGSMLGAQRHFFLYIYLFIFNFTASLSVESVQYADICGHAAACTKDEGGGGESLGGGGVGEKV